MSLREEIDRIKYLFLTRIGEPKDNALVLGIQEGLLGPPEDLDILGVKLENTRPINVKKGSRGFAIYFDRYVAYSVRNESYTVFAEDEEWKGVTFREYQRSHYLNFIAAATFAIDEYPGPLRHYGIMCENHVIDIVSAVEPEIDRWDGA